ncbi:MAG TPA: glycosyltransferase [Nitrososphaerales archaeon]|nr:glycosyltransferase [Nitrososphaerales archaeon]
MQKSEEIGRSQKSGQAAKHRLYTFTVGICATGHPQTLRPLLETVLSSEMPGFVLSKVVLVASDCSEETVRVARSIAARDRRLRLIEHERRTGKADAINEIFRETEGEFLVYVNADALIGPDSIPALLRSIEEDRGTGFVSGRPVFVKPSGIISDVLDVMWTSFDFLSSDPNQSEQKNHGTDELMVIRSELLSELPFGVVNDGAYIAGRIREKGFRIGFQPEAVVQIDVPRRMIDLIRQRRRILFGHIQVKRLLGKAPRTVETMMFFSPLESFKIVIRMLASRPRRVLVLPIATMGELIALSGALWDTFVSNAGHAVWKRYEQGDSDQYTQKILSRQ